MEVSIVKWDCYLDNSGKHRHGTYGFEAATEQKDCRVGALGTGKVLHSVVDVSQRRCTGKLRLLYDESS